MTLCQGFCSILCLEPPISDVLVRVPGHLLNFEIHRLKAPDMDCVTISYGNEWQARNVGGPGAIHQDLPLRPNDWPFPSSVAPLLMPLKYLFLLLVASVVACCRPIMLLLLTRLLAIPHDASVIDPADVWLRLQVVSTLDGDQFSIVTLDANPPRPEANVETLKFLAGRGMRLGFVMTLLRRHSCISTLRLEHGTVFADSLRLDAPSAHFALANLTTLAAPAAYIPHILPLAPNVTHLEIILASRTSYDTRCPQCFWRRKCGCCCFCASCCSSAYTRAIITVANSGSVRVLSLHIASKIPRKSLPWRGDEESGFETHLRGVATLKIFCVPEKYESEVFNGADALAVLRWLLHFPALEWVGLPLRVKEELLVHTRRLGAPSLSVLERLLHDKRQ
ncbi:hypothetical protein B0H16DRAFT_1693844 [Mycena metata]|uniref:Uncharacterized protein n=1 Tax=Mycena metata TaxID=1033252 RepID=A0AAD7N243_9AGAR|nr:hypothetical protein B0H16DRAFT_1693844 [Mycena metata]